MTRLGYVLPPSQVLQVDGGTCCSTWLQQLGHRCWSAREYLARPCCRPRELPTSCRCLQHLRQVLPLTGSAEQHLTWYNCTNDSDLLTVADQEDVLAFRSISGTSDIAIITTLSSRLCMERKGLCILFELKKPGRVDRKAVNQALCEVVLANFLSPKFQPVVVLTDLCDAWQLLWMDGSVVKVAAVADRSAALTVISSCIQHAAATAATTAAAAGAGSATTFTWPAGLPSELTAREPAMFPADPDAEADVGNLADLQGFLPDDEVQYARASILLQRLLLEEGALPLRPAPKPHPDMYA
jgi:hypothetical protein